MTRHMPWVLVVWVLANQGGVPVPVTPWLLAAGALAGSGQVSVTLVLACTVAAALGADLRWYSLERWRGALILASCFRVVPLPSGSFNRIGSFLRAHQAGFMWSARFLPGVNPVAARLAGAAGMPLVRFLCHAAGSALGWAGGWTALGYLLGGMVLERGGSFRNRLDWNSGGRPRCGCKECSDHARRAPSPRTARWDRRCRVGPHHESGEVSGSPARGADSGRIAPERTDAREPLAVIPERRRVQHDEAERPPVTRSTRARC